MELHPVGGDDWKAFRDLRLRALREDPDAFGATYEDQRRRTANWWREWASKSEAGETHVLFLASNAGTWVGMAGGVVEDETAWLISMWVAPEARRRGIGRRLTNAIVAWAREGGRPRIALHVETTNQAATALYRSMGFEPTGETLPLDSNPELRVMRLERDLRAPD